MLIQTGSCSKLNSGLEVYIEAEKIVCSTNSLSTQLINFGSNSAAMDISADLQELTRCPVGLVSSGVKSILDIGRFVIFLHLLLNFRYHNYIRTLEHLVKVSLLRP